MGAATGDGRMVRDNDQGGGTLLAGLWRGLRSLLGLKNGDSQLRETIEEISGAAMVMREILSA